MRRLTFKIASRDQASVFFGRRVLAMVRIEPFRGCIVVPMLFTIYASHATAGAGSAGQQQQQLLTSRPPPTEKCKVVRSFKLMGIPLSHVICTDAPSKIPSAAPMAGSGVGGGATRNPG